MLIVTTCLHITAQFSPIHLVKKLPAVVKLEGSVPCSEKPSHPQEIECSPHIPIIFLYCQVLVACVTNDNGFCIG